MLLLGSVHRCKAFYFEGRVGSRHGLEELGTTLDGKVWQKTTVLRDSVLQSYCCVRLKAAEGRHGARVLLLQKPLKRQRGGSGTLQPLEGGVGVWRRQSTASTPGFVYTVIFLSAPFTRLISSSSNVCLCGSYQRLFCSVKPSSSRVA